MAEQVFPTKGNLINTRKSLQLARLGYELLDRKRNILIREMLTMIDTANSLRGNIEEAYIQAYKALERANITLGMIYEIAKSVPIEDSITVTCRSVMGVVIPTVKMDEKPLKIFYGFKSTNSALDIAYKYFDNVKKMTVVLAEIENSIFRIATAIKKTQSRANALKNIIIPRLETTAKFISDSLEEKEREEFSRLKVIKAQKSSK